MCPDQEGGTALAGLPHRARARLPDPVVQYGDEPERQLRERLVRENGYRPWINRPVAKPRWPARECAREGAIQQGEAIGKSGDA